MGNDGKKFKREIKLVIVEAAKIGGIAQILLATFTFCYNYFGEPFRELNLGIMFQKMRERTIWTDGRKLDIYLPNDSNLTYSFYFKFFCFKRWLCCYNKLYKKD